jgi:hypothetical protein
MRNRKVEVKVNFDRANKKDYLNYKLSNLFNKKFKGLKLLLKFKWDQN